MSLKHLKKKASQYESSCQWVRAAEIHQQIATYQSGSGSRSALYCTQNQIGVCYFNAGHHDKAIDAFQILLTKIKHIPDVYINCALCCAKLKRRQDAIRLYLSALMVSTDEAVRNKIYASLGDQYYILKKYAQSIQGFYDKITDTTSAEYQYNRSFPHLAQKQFQTGFALYENRLAKNAVDANGLGQRVELPKTIPYWDGIEICTRLLVVYEQGFGDNIQFYRFLLQLAALYPDTHFDYFCHPKIAHLFGSVQSSPNVHIVDNAQLPLYSHYVYIMSIPNLLSLDTIDPLPLTAELYIQTNLERDEYWRNQLDIRKQLGSFERTIGFTYQGRLHGEFIDKKIAFRDICRVIQAVSRTLFVCLHPWTEIESDFIEAKEKGWMPENVHAWKNLDTESKPFEDTISILRNVNECITIDSAVVHLAGVLQVPTRLLLGAGSEWRWSDTNECYWYSNVKLIRAAQDTEFATVLPILQTDLACIL